MVFIWKNKGILIPIYLIVSFAGTALVAGILERNIGGIFTMFNSNFYVGISFLIVAVWTHFTKDDTYIDKSGNKKKLEIDSTFFFMKLEIWIYVFIILAFIFLLNSFFHYF